jgi:hypothetical protein
VQEYLKAQLYVFPTFAETLGMVTIESMAMKKPVVNSSLGWAKRINYRWRKWLLGCNQKTIIEYAAKDSIPRG